MAYSCQAFLTGVSWLARVSAAAVQTSTGVGNALRCRKADARKLAPRLHGLALATLIDAEKVTVAHKQPFQRQQLAEALRNPARVVVHDQLVARARATLVSVLPDRATPLQKYGKAAILPV